MQLRRSSFVESLFGGFWCRIWWFVDIVSVRARNLLNLKRCIYNEFVCFYTSTNIICDDCHAFFRYLFWHWFLMGFGIEFGSNICHFLLVGARWTQYYIHRSGHLSAAVLWAIGVMETQRYPITLRLAAFSVGIKRKFHLNCTFSFVGKALNATATRVTIYI